MIRGKDVIQIEKSMEHWDNALPSQQAEPSFAWKQIKACGVLIVYSAVMQLRMAECSHPSKRTE